MSNPNNGHNKAIENAQRDGFRLGLKYAFKMIREREMTYGRLEKETPKESADLRDDYAYGRKVLAEICAELREEIGRL